MPEAPSLVVETTDGVALLTINRPERRNALDDELFQEVLPDTLRSIATNPGIHAVVLTGAGEAFSAGADIEGCHGWRCDDAAAAEDYTRGSLQTPVLLRSMPQITIAAVNGVAVGAGFGLALACDARFASPAARFRAPFILMGLVPDMGLSYFLPRLLGAAKTIELLIRAEWIDSTRAEELGLVGTVSTTYLEDALEFARLAASRAPRALRVTKEAVYRSEWMTAYDEIMIEEARTQGVALLGPEFKERFEAYVNGARSSSS